MDFKTPDIQRFPIWLFAGVVTITFIILWLVHEYIAFFLSMLIPLISFFVLLVSLMTEYLERSRIPSWYYKVMACLIILPLIVLLVMAWFNEFEWPL